MSIVYEVARRIDALGCRKMVATLATLTASRSSGQKFAVSAKGEWINMQPDAVVVSPTIHTARYDQFRAWVLDNWCWHHLPKLGDTVIDVGAGVGEEAVVLSHLVGPTGSVISIEAHPATFACLEQTVQRSGLTNVLPLMVALGDADGIARIGSAAEHLKNSILVGAGDTEVPMRTLCSLLRELEIDRVDLLKLNIEGAERLAVRGMAECADRLRHVVISCHDFLAERGDGEQLRTREEVRAMLASQGFDLKTRPEHADAWTRDYLYGSRAPVTELRRG